MSLRSIASQLRPAAATPIDPAAITPSDQLGDLQLAANGRSDPFAEHAPPNFAPPSDYFPPANTIRPVQLMDTATWRWDEWDGDIQADWGFTADEEDEEEEEVSPLGGVLAPWRLIQFPRSPITSGLWRVPFTRNSH